jgi:hypothetical protein
MTASDADWLKEVSELFPVGAPVSVSVTARHPFGVFVALDDHPEMRAIVEINNYRPGGEPVPPEGLPQIGVRLEAVVVDHTTFNRQVRLRVAPVDKSA